MTAIVPIEKIVNRIYIIRGQKVILDSDIAVLYNVSTKRLNEQVRRNEYRFPPDFMFRLSPQEMKNLQKCLSGDVLRSQIATSKQGGRRYAARVFTEHGVAMLSGVLKSRKAVEINILIIRAFIKIREILFTHKKLAIKIAQLETKYDEQFVAVFNALQQLVKKSEVKKPSIGFMR